MNTFRDKKPLKLFNAIANINQIQSPTKKTDSPKKIIAFKASPQNINSPSKKNSPTFRFDKEQTQRMKEIPFTQHTLESNIFAKKNWNDMVNYPTYKQLNLNKKIIKDKEGTNLIIKDVRLKSRLIDKKLFTNFINILQETERNEENVKLSFVHRNEDKFIKGIANKFIENCKDSKTKRTTNNGKYRNPYDPEVLPKDPPLPSNEQMVKFIEHIKFNETNKVEQKLKENPGYSRSWDYAGLSALHWACIKRDLD